MLNAKSFCDLVTAPGGQNAFYQGGEPDWVVRPECDLRDCGVWNVEFGPSEEEIYQHRQSSK
jgi:hypothetical protein